MPGAGHPGDPLWTAVGFVVGSAAGVYLHQYGLGIALRLVIGGTCGLIREDIRRGNHRPANSLWFAIGTAIGLAGGIWLHYAGLGWLLSLGLGLALGLVFGAVLGTWRADLKRTQDHERHPFL